MDLDNLVDKWIRAQETEQSQSSHNHWSVDYVIDLNVQDRFNELWAFVLQVYKRDISDNTLMNLAAGPLEDLLASAGPKYIDEVEELARKDPKFRKLLGGVWQNDINDDLWNRVKKAANV